ncbi:MAG TPA: SIMPL domain-containing protein [Microvirga sp.]|nr:SIMPL domain-containing protein [Microvirga sp.]
MLGRGSFETKPDLARFSARVSTDARSLESAAKQHEERATRAMKLLQELKASGLETEKSNFTINERRGPRPLSQTEIAQGKRPESVIEGYVATTSFSLKVDSLEKLNQLATKLAETGLFEIQKVNFGVTDERAALNQARRAAMLDALEQAHAYTEPVDLELEQIVAITDGEATPPNGEADMPYRRADARYTVQIIPPAALEFNASVNVTWRIAPKRP